MIELKITGDTASEVMKHLAELTGGFMLKSEDRPAALPDYDDEISVEQVGKIQQVADKTRRGRKPKAEAVEAEPEADVGEHTSIGESATSAEASVAEAPITNAQPSSASDVSDEAYYEEVVTPTVLGYVRSKGKPWVVEILNEFGVERASDLKSDPARLRELIDTMNERA